MSALEVQVALGEEKDGTASDPGASPSLPPAPPSGLPDTPPHPVHLSEAEL